MADSQQIGRYQIIEELGRGGMARVYRAHDPNFGRAVALKVISERVLTEGTARRRFDFEAQTIAALEHRAIVPVYDFGEEDGRPYLVMRLMTGGSLADRLGRGPLSPAVIQRVLERIGAALDKAHDNGIVHRDLKPGNILFDDDGQPYLSDFGIVKSAGSTRLTAVGGLIGTPAYMSPEQVLGTENLDGRSDIYSLGAVLYEMLTGRQPYDSETGMGVAMAHVTQPVPRLQDVAPDIPSVYQSVIDRAMAKEPGERYSKGIDLAAAFRNPQRVPAPNQTVIEPPDDRTVIEPLVVGAASTAATTAPAEAKGERPLWKIIAPLALLLLVAFAVFMMRDMFVSEPTADPAFAALAATVTAQALEKQATGIAGTAVAEARETMAAEAAALTPDSPEEEAAGADAAGAATAAETPTPAPTAAPSPTDTPAATATLEGPYGRIAFVSDRAGQDEIYVMDVRSPQDARQITDAIGSDGRDWWPSWCGENRLVFERGDHPWQSELQEIAMVDVDSGSVHNITSGSIPAGSTFNGLPSCSHDGKLLAFSMYSSEQVINWAVGFIDLEASSPRFRLLGNDGYALAGNVSWSPNDRALVFMYYNRDEKNYHIYRVELDDPYDYTDLSGAFGGNNKYPDWSPDGKWVAFTCGKTEGDNRRWSLCLTPSDSSRVEVVLPDMHFGPERWQDLQRVRHALTPNWSPDGKWLAFSSDIDGDFDIYIYSLIENKLINLTEDWTSDEIHPNWER